MEVGGGSWEWKSGLVESVGRGRGGGSGFGLENQEYKIDEAALDGKYI